jgi:predicted ATPase/DNA-binding winged helix-turn-helix (wHTH) protein
MGSALADRYQFGGFTLDGQGARLREGTRDIGLRPKSFELLQFLLANADRLVTKDELLAAVWPRVVVTEDSLTRCISEVRAALGEEGQQAIRTVPKRGYRFVMPVTRLAAAPPPVAAARTNLPDSMPMPLGREDDLARLGGLIAGHRLVTLVGPGGVGKSRLARWLLHERRDAFAHGVSWVDLSALREAGSLVSTLSAAVGLSAGAGEPLNTLLAALRPLHMLIALDNAEHLIDEVAQLARALHDGAPEVRLVVTSQVPLKLQAETAYRLQTLAVPEAGTPLAEALRSGAVALFAQRASAADAAFELTPGNVGFAIEICRRLDGLPLSIELAAARAPVLGLSALAALLDERFRALTGGRRDAPGRHQTLQAAMAWSHSLLGEVEAVVFRRLGVFAGSFTLAAAQQVVAGPGLDGWRVLDAVGELVERSLVAVDRLDPPRYRLLETTRAFAVERLAEAGETPLLARQHALAYRAFLEAAYADCFSGRQTIDQWRELQMLELDSGLAASAWALGHDPESAVSLAATLAVVVSNERPQDRRRLLEATRPLMSEALPAALRARWQLEAAFDWGAVQPAWARSHAQAAVALFRGLGDRLGLYRALSILLYCRPAAPADEQHAEIDELQAIEDPAWPAVVRAQGAHAAACWFSAREAFEIAIDWRHKTVLLYEQAGGSWQQLVAQANLMDSQLAAGRVDEAIACGVALEARLRGTRQLAALPAARLNLTAALLFKNEPAQARVFALDGWPQALQLAWQPYWADYLALLAATEGRLRAATRLLGYADARYLANASTREINEARAARRVGELTAEGLEPHELERLKAAGRALRDDEVAAQAFATADAA